MDIMVLFLLIVIGLFIIGYRIYGGKNVTGYVNTKSKSLYTKFAPYSYDAVKDKVQELGQQYSYRQYLIQAILIGAFAAAVSYIYFYNILISIIYVVVSILFIPYLSLLRSRRIYSEFIFEQVQVYTTNTIMEFATTKSFVKSLEGVLSTNVLEEPIKSDVKHMIDLAYKNGSIDESLNYMNTKYPYYIVKNMHQLFLQITKEGARDTGESLENMQLDIDMLVEGVYRDRIERKTFHGKFLKYGFTLYLLAMLVQYLIGRETYIILLDRWYVQILLHGIIIINTYFLITGEKYYNENVGAE